MYRDLKPENVVLDEDGFVRLVDFGFTKAAHPRSTTLCGTLEYCAPESIQLQGHGQEVDWWALGIITYELLHGYTPFSAEGTLEDPIEIAKRITHPDCKVAYFPTLSPSAASFMKRLLRRKWSSRLGADGADSVRSHAWFETFDWHALERRDPSLWRQATPIPRAGVGHARSPPLRSIRVESHPVASTPFHSTRLHSTPLQSRPGASSRDEGYRVQAPHGISAPLGTSPPLGVQGTGTSPPLGSPISLRVSCETMQAGDEGRCAEIWGDMGSSMMQAAKVQSGPVRSSQASCEAVAKPATAESAVANSAAAKSAASDHKVAADDSAAAAAAAAKSAAGESAADPTATHTPTSPTATAATTAATAAAAAAAAPSVVGSLSLARRILADLGEVQSSSC